MWQIHPKLTRPSKSVVITYPDGSQYTYIVDQVWHYTVEDREHHMFLNGNNDVITEPAAREINSYPLEFETAQRAAEALVDIEYQKKWKEAIRK